MAQMGEYRLTLEVDQEKIEALRQAEERFATATREVTEALREVQDATYRLRDSLKVKRVED